MLFICFLVGVMCVKALPRLECMGLEGREEGRSTSSYRNPQLVTANVNALQAMVAR